MKILQVNCVYQKGSTGKIVYDIHGVLQKKGIESVVCYGRGRKIDGLNIYKTSSEFLSKFNNLKSRFMGFQYNGSFFATNKLISIIKKEKPDIVHLHCINGYFVNIYRLITYLKINDIKTVLTLHAEFMYTGSCGYAYACDKWKTGCGDCPQLKVATNSYLFDRTHTAWLKMKKAFEGFDNLTVVGCSRWITNRAKLSPLLTSANFYTIHNGIETKNIFFNRKEMLDDIKVKYGVQNCDKIILHVTPSFLGKRKGGYRFVELANRMKTDKEVKFIIVGYKGEKENISNNIITINRTEDQNELAAFYSLADLLVITSDCENYPTVCLEAASCGTPIIGFDVGGVKETIPKGMGEVVKPFNIEVLLQSCRKYMNKKKEITSEVLKTISIYNSKERMTDEYISLYKEMMNYKY